MVRTLTVGIDQLILVLLKCYGKPLEKRLLHKYLRDLVEKVEVKEKVQFYGWPPFSPAVNDKVKELVEKGMVRNIYVVGPAYTELYKEYIKLTEEGIKLIESLDNIKELEEIIRKLLKKDGEVET